MQVGFKECARRVLGDFKEGILGDCKLDSRSVQGGCTDVDRYSKEGARWIQGGYKEGSKRVQGGYKDSSRPMQDLAHTSSPYSSLSILNTFIFYFFTSLAPEAGKAPLTTPL